MRISYNSEEALLILLSKSTTCSIYSCAKDISLNFADVPHLHLLPTCCWYLCCSVCSPNLERTGEPPFTLPCFLHGQWLRRLRHHLPRYSTNCTSTCKACLSYYSIFFLYHTAPMLTCYLAFSYLQQHKITLTLSTFAAVLAAKLPYILAFVDLELRPR